MSEALDELCEQALIWGVSWELYWYGEMSAVLPYYNKWKAEQELEQQVSDTNAWLVGLYVQKAIHSAFSKQGEYPSKPFYMEKLQQQNVPDEDKVVRDFIQLDDWRRAFTQNFRMDKERN